MADCTFLEQLAGEGEETGTAGVPGALVRFRSSLPEHLPRESCGPGASVPESLCLVTPPGVGVLVHPARPFLPHSETSHDPENEALS